MDKTTQCAQYRHMLPFNKATDGQTDIKHDQAETLSSNVTVNGSS